MPQTAALAASRKCVNVCIKNPFLMMMRGARPQCYYFSRKREGGQFFVRGRKKNDRRRNFFAASVV
ncbi:hypothetical protein HMP0721_1399 [Pseudoramibacter alactolyticus ATCC 23263]|uniref:Uncharacterized protein n=1 Tax=Pseudoramibacter alactolyticus ATCC 23263 TaxID=887929 RepID=E6MHB4_9FIRM|nr:hypothetical protein HMP0721_1399 [Pseudoramibacter alactolyticus ATCC 23263]